MPDNFASLDGEDLVIRIPYMRLLEILADAGPGSSLQYPVTVERKHAFFEQLLEALNGSNSVESMITCDVGVLLEDRRRSVKEHLPVKARRRAA